MLYMFRETGVGRTSDDLVRFGGQVCFALCAKLSEPGCVCQNCPVDSKLRVRKKDLSLLLGLERQPHVHVTQQGGAVQLVHHDDSALQGGKIC